MRNLTAILVLFALTLLYFSDVLTGQLLLVERDLSTFFYPFRFIWIETARQGTLPFWNPYIKCGVPLFATVQAGVLYPLSLPYLFLPLDLAFNWTIVLHFFLAAVFTYALMRELGATVQGALTGALAFLFSGYLISVHNMLNTLLSVSWYPLLMLCCCRTVQYGKMRWAVASAGSLCCMFLAGGMEIVIFSFASYFLLCLYPELLPLRRTENLPSLRRRLGLLGVTLIVFLGVSMVQLLPFLEVYSRSVRHGGIGLEKATRWSLAPRDLLYFLLPDIYGQRISPDRYWKFQNYLKSIYMGPVCFFLAGIYFVRQGKRALPLLAALGLVLLLALGRYTPLYPFFYKHLPLFSTFRYPAKFLFLFAFYLCIVGGLGLDILARRFLQKHQPALWRNALLVVAILVLAGILLLLRFSSELVQNLLLEWWGSVLDPEFLPTALHNLNRLLFLTILTLIVLFFGLRHKLTRIGGPLLLMLLSVDLFLGNIGYALKLEAKVFHTETEIIRTLKSDGDLFRFHVMPEIRLAIRREGDYKDFHLKRKHFLDFDLMMEHHLFDVEGYNVPLQRRYEMFKSLIWGRPLKPPVPNILNLSNVKYVLSAHSIDLPGYVWVQDGRRGSKLYENRNHLPRVFLVKNFQVLKDDQEFARVFHDPTFNPRHTVLLEKVPTRLLALKREPAAALLQPGVRVVSYENNRIVLEVRTPEAALLFMSEAFYPGWKAYVDGKDEEILRANYVFRAIPVGPGSHRIEVLFEPLSFKIGLAVSLITLALLLTGWIIWAKRKGSGAWSIGHRA